MRSLREAAGNELPESLRDPTTPLLDTWTARKKDKIGSKFFTLAAAFERDEGGRQITIARVLQRARGKKVGSTFLQLSSRVRI